MLFHLITAAIALYFPISQYLTLGTIKRKIEADPAMRLHFYKETIAYLWIIAAAVAATLWYRGVPIADLGFGFELAVVPVSVALVLLAIAVAILKSTPISSDNYESMRDAHSHVRFILPENQQQYKWMLLTSLTAGITEEFIFRAYLFWYFSQYMNWLPAVILLNLVFCLCHIWSGPKNMLGSFLLGISFSAIYLVSGSILLAMLAHILVDIQSGRVGYGLSEYEHSGKEAAAT